MADLFPPSETLSHHADAEAVDSFIAWRKKLKKPLTDRAAKMLAKTLADINAAGGDATEALDMAQERGWMTIKVAWYFRSKEQDNGQQPNRMGGAGRSGVNSAVQPVSRAARFDRSSLKDMF